MDNKTILKAVDHTLLKQTATWNDIKIICDDAIKYEVASVCIPPSFVKQAKEYVGNKMKVCTVIGFPNGYNTTAVKVFETKDAIQNGADEIDMVINLSMLKDKKYDEITKEIRQIKEACGENILKVIIETCLLTEDEKIKMCKCVTDAKADFIKTSTGFSTGGATAEDIVLFKENVGENVSIKAAGGIKDLDTAKDFIAKGSSRLGTSSIIKIINNEEVAGY
ncbi:deoxyribose-phosphate aldolase [Clostridium sp. CCUG 7971]|uniref:deoxyribose-phosphate aldolase n=1 Tax=Clostridium sp. CCUG 7971 TaxID=2811414 RepID=UPI001ABAA2CF|nr:deoxyribose-phosphate aldolase [Clostridium sp. CCUG 7971]MBO3444275.1 deoxyribose-phosphate aldolase [Clostridium sp. CCUG 7971]